MGSRQGAVTRAVGCGRKRNPPPQEQKAVRLPTDQTHTKKTNKVNKKKLPVQNEPLLRRAPQPVLGVTAGEIGWGVVGRGEGASIAFLQNQRLTNWNLKRLNGFWKGSGPTEAAIKAGDFGRFEPNRWGTEQRGHCKHGCSGGSKKPWLFAYRAALFESAKENKISLLQPLSGSCNLSA